LQHCPAGSSSKKGGRKEERRKADLIDALAVDKKKKGEGKDSSGDHCAHESRLPWAGGKKRKKGGGQRCLKTSDQTCNLEREKKGRRSVPAAMSRSN